MPYLKRLTVLAASLAAVLGTAWTTMAVPASAAAVYQKNGTYQFASYTPATSGNFVVSNKPLSYSDASQSLGANGVNLNASGSGDSGVIVPLGRLSSLFNADGKFVPPTIVGSNLEGYNLYFDTNADDTYFGWAQNGSIDPYILTSFEGDTAASLGTVNNTNDQADFTTFAGEPGASNLDGTLTGTMTMEAVRTAYANRTDGNPDTNPLVWAWIGLGDGVTSGPGYVTSVDGTPLVTEVPAVNPVKGLTATAKFTNLTANWNASRGATSYKVTVTTHRGAVTVFAATVTLTTLHVGRLKENTGYAVHVLAEPAAPGAKPTTVDVRTK